MNGNGVGIESIQDDHVKAPIGLAGQGEAGIAEYDVSLARAIPYESKQRGVFRDRDHRGVDIEEGPALAGALVARDRASAQPDHRDAPGEPRAAHALEELTQWTVPVVIAQW